MIAKAKALTKSKFVRNVAIIASGTAGAQAISMAFAPVITRLYGPEAFGMLGTFMAVLAVLTPVAALTYPIAIVLPKSDADAKTLAKLSAVLALAVALITALVLSVGGDWIAKALSLEAIAGFLLLIPVAMVFSAYQQILTQWLIRKKQFKITARVAVFQALTVNSAKAGVGWFHPVGAALVVIASIGQAFHALLLWMGMKGRTEALPRPEDEPTGSTRELVKRHRDFPMYRAPQATISALSMNIPILMLASLFGPAAAGFYTLAKTIMGVPSVLISKSVSDVFYPRAAEAVNEGKSISVMLLRSTLGLAAIGFIPLLVIIIYGPVLFNIVFGEEWEFAGKYARWLAVFMFFNFINSPAVSSIAVLNMQRWFLFYGMFSAGMRAVGLYLGYLMTKDPIFSVAIFSIFGSVAYLYLIGYTIFKSKFYFCGIK